jgi:hypothetical protein
MLNLIKKFTFSINTDNILITSSIYSLSVQMFWSKHKEKIVDFFLFLTITLSSTVLYCLTFVLKIKILIFKLKDQIKEIKNVIVLLDNQAILLEQQAENRLIAAAVGLGIVILLGLLCFFFSGGGGSGPGGSASSSMGDSFSSKSSEGSLSRLPSTTDLVTPTETVAENLGLQQELLNQLQLSLNVILARAGNTLLPTLSNWIEFSHQKTLHFDESPTVRVGNSVIGWIESLNSSIEQIQNNNVSMEVLNSVNSTLSSITSKLPHFLRQLDHFIEKANLSPDAAHHEFILESRIIANKLLETLLKNEALLKEMVPDDSFSFVFPEWFPGLLRFFSMLNVVDNSGLLGIKGRILTLCDLLFNNNTTGTTALSKYKYTLLNKLCEYYKEIRDFLDGTTDRISAIKYICAAETDKDFDNLISLLIKLKEYHKSLGVNPCDIFLFV